MSTALISDPLGDELIMSKAKSCPFQTGEELLGLTWFRSRERGRGLAPKRCDNVELESYASFHQPSMCSQELTNSSPEDLYGTMMNKARLAVGPG